MPNRILKESICTSETIAELSWFEEVLFYRLIVSADDFGRYDARPAIIKGRLFPLSGVTVKQISDALNKLASVGIVILYGIDGHGYLQISTWERHQSPRAKKSKYPSPPDNLQAIAYTCTQLQADANDCVQMSPINENENGNDIRYSSNENDTRDNSADGATRASRVDYEAYRQAFLEACPSLPQPSEAAKWSAGRKKAVRDKRMSPVEMRSVFERVEKSDFLSGRNGKWDGCSFDWILKPSNWQKIIEGNYDNRKNESDTQDYSFDLDEYERTSRWGYHKKEETP